MSHSHALTILVLIIVGVFAGGILGWVHPEAAVSVGWMGKLFLNALKMTIIPLIMAAVITGIASLGDVRKLGRAGGTTVLYFLITSGIAVTIGLLAVNIIEPGAGQQATLENTQAVVDPDKAKSMVDILMMMIAPNLIEAAVNMEMLPLIFFAVVFGAAMTTVGEAGKPVIGFFASVNDVMMRLVTWIMYFAPIGIFALVAARLGQAGGGPEFWATITDVGMYVMTVIAALTVHFLVLITILAVVAGGALSYLSGMLRALLTAFGTASSSATLPLTMECARESGVSDRAVRFVLPLGSTLNMNGTALYEAVAALFIAQAFGVELTFTEQMLVFITATLAAVGAAGIPEAGLVTMLIVLQAVGLPEEGIALLLAVDWFLDRFRTTVNVWGDAVGAAVMSHLFKHGVVDEPSDNSQA